MKILKFLLLSTLAGSVMLTSCTKNEGINNNNNDQLNYDALYVVNRGSNSLSVVNLNTDNVEKTISLGTVNTGMGGGMMGGNNSANLWPYHISLSPDKSKLAITEPGMDFTEGYDMMHTASSGTGRILILDAITGDLLKEVAVQGMPFDAIFSPDGREIWAGLMMTVGKVVVLDADSYMIKNTITVGNMPAGVSFSDDGKKVFVANGMSGSLMVIDAGTKMITDTIPSSQGVVGVYTGMNGMMYTDNEQDNTISIINAMNNMMSDSIRLQFTPGMVSTDPMTDLLWVSDPMGSKIHYWSQSGSSYNYGGYINVGSGAGDMIFSPNGATCYVSNRNENTVSIVDVPGLRETMKIHVGEKPGGLVIRYK